MCHIFKEFVRFVIFVSASLFTIIGATLVLIGTLHLVNSKFVTDTFGSLHLIPYLLITIGFIIFVISFFGCQGAYKRNQCFLYTYGCILLVFFVVQVALGAYIISQLKNKGESRQNIEETVNYIFENTENTLNKETVDFVQQKLECCGTYGPIFWFQKLKVLPKSCYKSEANILPFTSGCTDKILHLLKNILIGTGVGGLILAMFEASS
ncbi:hypothetical protein Zmor_025827 [Zophobas morio]|uniref:Tetraspanin n=1 Tax=Zophobas morio TaxID=2755281 RepID=A0AA38HUV4_9CUCU|nr:hypothetical protein Zmor_025827 [Zophobas morio]